MKASRSGWQVQVTSALLHGYILRRFRASFLGVPPICGNGKTEAQSKDYRELDCLQDIVDNIARIERHLEGLDQDGLAKDGMRHDAVERCLERICEAAFRLGDRAAILMPAQPWKAIRGLGNRLRHAYGQIDISIIWNVVSERLPDLKADAVVALEHLADAAEPGDDG